MRMKKNVLSLMYRHYHLNITLCRKTFLLNFLDFRSEISEEDVVNMTFMMSIYNQILRTKIIFCCCFDLFNIFLKNTLHAGNTLLCDRIFELVRRYRKYIFPRLWSYVID